jgi:hypothetical protein
VITAQDALPETTEQAAHTFTPALGKQEVKPIYRRSQYGYAASYLGSHHRSAEDAITPNEGCMSGELALA